MTSNICRANFNGGRTAQGNNRYQWDYGQILEISGIDNLPDPFVAQFSNTPVLGTAKSTVGAGGRVEIPNEYFVSGQNIYCFIVLHTGEDDGRTVYIATIPVTKRPKPIDDPITPTQQSTIDTAIAALQAGVSRAEGFAGDAEEQAGIAQSAATTATEAATRAEGAVADVEAAATRAETAAEDAEASATAAGESATGAESAKTAALTAKSAAETAAASAEQSATDAGNYAGLAEEAETSAATSATAAETSATAAAGSASAASGSASQAAQKASEASESATAAETSATNAEAAKTGAETAQTAAETAQASAEEAAANAEQSATTAEWYSERVERFLPTDTASGEIASFPDGADSVPMQSVVVSMEPIQDLHGYDHPWPAGGGKNILPPPTQETQTVNGVTVKANADGSITFSGTASSPASINFVFFDLAAGDYILSNIGSDAASSGATTSIYVRDNTNGVTLTSFGLGNSASGLAFTLTETVNIRFYAVLQSGSTVSGTLYPMIRRSGDGDNAYAPYSNICPISGRTGADIEHTGKNLFDKNNALDGYIDDADGDLKGSAPYKSTDYIRVSGGGSYYVKSEQTSSMWGAWYEKNKNFVSGVTNYANSVITAPSNASYVRLTSESSASGNVNTFAVNYPSTDTSYHAYQGETISVSWESEAGTVYGGTLDVVSGDLVVDRAMLKLNTADMNNNNNYPGWRDLEELPEIVGAGVNTPVPATLNIGWSAVGVNTTAVTSGILYLPVGTYKKSQDEWKALAMDIEILLYYATPITYHLTPQEVRTLLGQNNIWSDAGEVTVTYKADVQLYIDKRISALS